MLEQTVEFAHKWQKTRQGARRPKQGVDSASSCTSISSTPMLGRTASPAGLSAASSDLSRRGRATTAERVTDACQSSSHRHPSIGASCRGTRPSASPNPRLVDSIDEQDKRACAARKRMHNLHSLQFADQLHHKHQAAAMARERAQRAADVKRSITMRNLGLDQS